MPKIEVKDGSDEVTILLDGDAADMSAGGHGKTGDIVLRDALGNERMRIGRITETGGGTGASPDITAQYWGIRVRTSTGANSIAIGFQATQQSPSADADMLLIVGGGGVPGTLVLRDKDAKQVMRLDGSDGTATIGGTEKGHLVIRGIGGKSVELSVAGDDQLVLVGPAGVNRLLLDAAQGNVWVGGHGADGDIVVLPAAATAAETAQATIHLDGDNATLRLGSKDRSGKIVVRDLKGQDVFRVETPFGTHMFVGGTGQPGSIHVVDPEGRDGILLDGIGGLDVGDPQGGAAGVVNIYDGAGNRRLTLDGMTGDIRLEGADCAEQLEVADSAVVEPGSVLVLKRDGKLHACDQPYDKRVVGVISGAGGVNPAIIMGDTPSTGRRCPIAMTGRVYCKVDARHASVEPGDLLTTSSLPGHAMKATDRARIPGTVVGKALGSLAETCGLVPVVVTLQ